MKTAKWQSPQNLRKLLNELVSWESITGSKGEQEFPFKLKEKLMKLPYFQNNPEFLTLHQVDHERYTLTALYKQSEVRDTICMISHYDTVPVDEYGDLQSFATKPDELTNIFHKRLIEHKLDEFPKQAQRDLASGDYLFGRGTMDMKMGIALQMQLMEKAINENWPLNLLLISVPDEEVNSLGMRKSVPKLLELQEGHNLKYIMFLNFEPVFTTNPEDESFYVYTGSVGKILTGALFFGKVTHAGEPFKGLTSPFIESFLTKEMEWNPLFIDESFDEKTPPPIVLQQYNLTQNYSTQTPYRSAALYNIFTMKRDAREVFHLFEKVAKTACNKLNKHYEEICNTYNVNPIEKVKAIRYSELVSHAMRKYGEAFIEKIIREIESHEEWDDREKSIRIVDKLMIECQELAPAIVIFIAPPYYPAVNSSGNELVENCFDYFKKRAKERFNIDVKRKHYFNGICDLSYVNYNGKNTGWTACIWQSIHVLNGSMFIRYYP